MPFYRVTFKDGTIEHVHAETELQARRKMLALRLGARNLKRQQGKSDFPPDSHYVPTKAEKLRV